MTVPDENRTRSMLFRFAERFDNPTLKARLRKAPDHLLDLLEPTPIGLAKAQAAWDSLTFAEQITVLGISGHFRRKPLFLRAARSTNSYVAWHARTLLGGEFDDEPTAEASDALAQYVSPPDFNEGEDVLSAAVAADFFALPQQARLAFVADNDDLWGLADVLAFAIKNLLPDGKVSEDELIDIVLQFGWRSTFLEHGLYDREPADAFEGMGDWLERRDASALWELAATAPERIGRALVNFLPPAPEEAIQKLPLDRLRWALQRHDVIATELRKSILLSEDDRWAECDAGFLAGAACCNVRLTYHEFSRLLALPDSRRTEVLKAFAFARNSLPLPILRAMRDVLNRQWYADESGLSGLHDYVHSLEQSIARAVKRVQAKDGGRTRRSAIRDQRLYELATYIVPWEGEPLFDKGWFGRNVPFLEEAVKPGDTWATFVRMWEVWTEEFVAQPNKEREQEKKLPKLDPPVGKRPHERLLDRTRRIDQQLRAISGTQLRIDGEIASLARSVNATAPSATVHSRPGPCDAKEIPDSSFWKRSLTWGFGFGLAVFLAAIGDNRYQSWRRVQPEAPVQWADGAVIAPFGHAAVSLVTQAVHGAVHYRLSVAFPGSVESLGVVAPDLARALDSGNARTASASPLTLNFLDNANIRLCWLEVDADDIIQSQPPPKPGWTGIEANGMSGLGGCSPTEISAATAWSMEWH